MHISEIEKGATNPLVARLLGGSGGLKPYHAARTASEFLAAIGLSIWQGIDQIAVALEENRRVVVESVPDEA